MAAVQLNVRIDEDLKRAGDAVLERFGVSTVQIVRELWQYMADHQKLPDFAADEDSSRIWDDDGFDDTGAGMALRMARESGLRVQLESMTYEELRESAYEEALLEKGERHA